MLYARRLKPKQFIIKSTLQQTLVSYLQCWHALGVSPCVGTESAVDTCVGSSKQTGSMKNNQSFLVPILFSSFYSRFGSEYLSPTLLSKDIKIKIQNSNFVCCFVWVWNLVAHVEGGKYRTVILSVFLCGCETWSLMLREEHRPTVFEKRVLRRIFGPKREEGSGDWRRLHNEELHDLYCSTNIIRIMK